MAQTQEVIDASQQVLATDVIIEAERVEELVLFAAQLTHHDDLLPSLDVSQDTQHFASTATFSNVRDFPILRRR
ncbi:hypothetical protein OKW49_008500 [Paraburkholderia youngii]|uniref:hypothetical protein n=1 Tax=Paraburkholderia youngii TaxID=2782701 RepID=UPI003D245CAD